MRVRFPPWARSTCLTFKIQWTRRPSGVLVGADSSANVPAPILWGSTWATPLSIATIMSTKGTTLALVDLPARTGTPAPVATGSPTKWVTIRPLVPLPRRERTLIGGKSTAVLSHVQPPATARTIRNLRHHHHHHHRKTLGGITQAFTTIIRTTSHIGKATALKAAPTEAAESSAVPVRPPTHPHPRSSLTSIAGPRARSFGCRDPQALPQLVRAARMMDPSTSTPRPPTPTSRGSSSAWTATLATKAWPR